MPKSKRDALEGLRVGFGLAADPDDEDALSQPGTNASLQASDNATLQESASTSSQKSENAQSQTSDLATLRSSEIAQTQNSNSAKMQNGEDAKRRTSETADMRGSDRATLPRKESRLKRAPNKVRERVSRGVLMYADLFQAAKIMAAKQGCTVSEIFEVALTEYIERQG